MDVKTARKYRDLKVLPSQRAPEHTWRTRPDPFDEVWPWIEEQFTLNPRLRAKTLFDVLQREHPRRRPSNTDAALRRARAIAIHQGFRVSSLNATGRRAWHRQAL